MTTTIERITAIIDEATADERAKVLDLERRLSGAYAEIVEEKSRAHDVAADLSKQLDNALTQVAVLLGERVNLHRQLVSVVENPTEITTPFGVLPCDAGGMRRLLDEIVKLNDDRVALGVERDAALTANARFCRDAHQAHAIDPRVLAVFVDPPADPQPGKLLVSRLDEHDVKTFNEVIQVWPNQYVGFLVDKPVAPTPHTWCIVGTRRDHVEVWGGKLGWNTIGALAYADKRDADAELSRLGRPALIDDVHVTTMAEWRRVMP